LEGQGLRDRSAEIEALGGVILGASFDPIEDNKSFADQQSFPYRLLSDVNREVGTRYEVLRDPDDKASNFAKRISYLIDPNGVIRKSYEVSDPQGHAEIVIEDLTKLLQ
jgi:peroxiredoxin Q/BCP